MLSLIECSPTPEFGLVSLSRLDEFTILGTEITDNASWALCEGQTHSPCLQAVKLSCVADIPLSFVKE